jgi:hypothetical protein
MAQIEPKKTTEVVSFDAEQETKRAENKAKGFFDLEREEEDLFNRPGEEYNPSAGIKLTLKDDYKYLTQRKTNNYFKGDKDATVRVYLTYFRKGMMNQNLINSIISI